MTPAQAREQLAARRTDEPRPYSLNGPTHTLVDCLTMPPQVERRIQLALKEIER